MNLDLPCTRASTINFAPLPGRFKHLYTIDLWNSTAIWVLSTAHTRQQDHSYHQEPAATTTLWYETSSV